MTLPVVNPDLGSDFYCLFDLDPNLTVVSGRTALAQSSFRRLITPAATLYGGLLQGVSDEELAYGTDLRSYLNAPMLTGAAIQRAVEKEVLKDERANDCHAEATAVEATGLIEIDVALTDGKGPFPFTVTVDKLTGAMLLEGP